MIRMNDMMKGNVAISEAAVRAGMEVYAGYPITPSTEVMEYLSGRMGKVGREFIQSESELAAINILIGVAACGRNGMTASSGPGISLMQEGISYMAQMELPGVILNVVRWGNGLGSLDGAQTDYLRETRGGGNGDYRNIVLCPSTVQESVDIMYEAFEIAQKYRCIVIIMTDSGLGQMMEPCSLPPFKEIHKAEWGLDGTYRLKRSDFLNRNIKKESEKYTAKLREMREHEQRWEAIETKDAEYVFVAFGLPARVTEGLVVRLRQRGEKVGLIRIISAWPFPEKAFLQLAEENPHMKGIIAVETTGEGQLVEDVALYAKKAKLDKLPIYVLPFVCGVPKESAIRDGFESIQAGKEKAVW